MNDCQKCEPTKVPRPHGPGFWVEIEVRKGDELSVRNDCGRMRKVVVTPEGFNLEMMLQGKLLPTREPIGLIFCGSNGFIWSAILKAFRKSGRRYATSNGLKGKL